MLWTYEAALTDRPGVSVSQATTPPTTVAFGSAALIAGYAACSSLVYAAGSGVGYQDGAALGSFHTS